MIDQLTPTLLLSIILAYFAVLMLISWWTGRNADNQDFFLAGRKSPWLLVAIGMIGASLSGVTFISIPGLVGAGGHNQGFSYMQMVLGYLVGYTVIALVLMPLYYRLNLTSIYGYLEQRFGWWSYKTGAAFFLLSRTLGASLRLYLVAIVLQEFVMDDLGIPFWVTVSAAIALIWVYTFRGGIKTIVWTDTLQTLSMLAAVVLTIFAIGEQLGENFSGLVERIASSDYSQVFFFDGAAGDPNNFFKQFVSGALIAVVMTGLDQDMMQKNLSCRTLGDAQKNMFTFSVILVFANILFVGLGALLYLYAGSIDLALPEKSDLLYPTIALEHLSPAIGVVFLIGLIAAAYSSADSALTALTTSFCVDFLNMEKSEATSNAKKRTRLVVHIGFSLLLLFIILLVRAMDAGAVLNELFGLAGYTYGPLLGLYAFGLLSRRRVFDAYVPGVCVAACALTYLLKTNQLFIGFDMGYLNILVNGLLTFGGLALFSTSFHPSENALEKTIS